MDERNEGMKYGRNERRYFLPFTIYVCVPIFIILFYVFHVL